MRVALGAHAVHLLLPPSAIPMDDYFDLLPGAEREVRVQSAAALDPGQVGVTCVNAMGPPTYNM